MGLTPTSRIEKLKMRGFLKSLLPESRSVNFKTPVVFVHLNKISNDILTLQYCITVFENVKDSRLRNLA